MPSLCFQTDIRNHHVGIEVLDAARASRAVSASPHTIKSSSFSMMRRSPWRTIGDHRR